MDRAPGPRTSPFTDSPEATAVEYSTRVIRVWLLQYEQEFGRARLERVWQQAGLKVPIAHVLDPSNYVSANFSRELTAAISADVGDDTFMRRAGQRIATAEAIGFGYHLLKAVGGPRLAYRAIVEQTRALNRTGAFRLERIGATSATLCYCNDRGEESRHGCETRIGALMAIPTIWGLEPAGVRETQCLVRGDGFCRYEVSWKGSAHPRRRWIWAALAGATGLIIAATVDLSLLSTAVIASAFGGLWGAMLDDRELIERQKEQLKAQQQGLAQVQHDLGSRYQELRSANLELESRVEERTEQLIRAKDELEKALAARKELDRLKSEFFDNVSHELRTPLSLLHLAVNALERDGLVAPEGQQYLGTLGRNATRLLKLINNLLDLAKIEAGQGRLRLESVCLEQLLDGILQPFGVMAAERQVQLTLEGQAPEKLQGDPDLLEAVFQNLLSNALKFTLQGRVTVRLSQAFRHSTVEVEDTGVGIAPEDLKRIFDRFAQADSAGVRRLSGTGIGLALVNQVVRLHGGTIEVRSVLGKGSVFRVVLPELTPRVAGEPSANSEQLHFLPPPEPQRAPGGDSRVDASVPSPTPALAPRFTVLVVEDDPELRAFICHSLAADYRVLEAVDGMEGLERAVAQLPDLIVSDLMMPRLSGLQLLDQLRRSSSTFAIPVLLLSARGDLESTLAGLGSGANDYLCKPFSPRELSARVRTQLRLREATFRQAQQEKLAAVGMLSSGFAHEVRNPINGILNSVHPLEELLSSGRAADPAVGELLRGITECGHRILHLAETLLSFARPGADGEPVDVSAALESTVKVLAWKMPPGVTLQKDYQCQDPVVGDAGALNQVWLNLLDNAVLAVGSEGLIQVSTVRRGDECVVTVKDSGPGIAEKDLPRMFQPFFSTRSSGGGTGLGLALCRRIVLQHHGRISAESPKGSGAIFRVHLPLYPPAPPERPGVPGS